MQITPLSATKCQYSDFLTQRLSELNKIAIKHKCKTVDIEHVKKGIAYCKYYHGSQLRKSGEPYYSHPIIVASMVAEYKFDEDIIIAALLHDTVEDTTLTYERIEAEFGSRVREMVYRLTRIRDGEKIGVDQVVNESIELDDKDALLIKFFDRMHNIGTIDAFSKEKQIIIAKESQDHILYLARHIDVTNEYINLESKIKKILRKENNILTTLKYTI